MRRRISKIAKSLSGRGLYQYEPLPGNEWTRLLRIWRSNQAGLCFDLDAVDLMSSPPFEAVSYTWGNPDRNQYILHRLGGRLYITQNCYDLLQNLCGNEPRTLWIDAICINQADLDERARQVAIMDRIYRSALRTVAYVGSSDSAFLTVQQVCNELGTQRGVLGPLVLEALRQVRSYDFHPERYFEPLKDHGDIETHVGCALLLGETYCSLAEAILTRKDLYDQLVSLGCSGSLIAGGQALEDCLRRLISMTNAVHHLFYALWTTTFPTGFLSDLVRQRAPHMHRAVDAWQRLRSDEIRLLHEACAGAAPSLLGGSTASELCDELGAVDDMTEGNSVGESSNVIAQPTLMDEALYTYLSKPPYLPPDDLNAQTMWPSNHHALVDQYRANPPPYRSQLPKEEQDQVETCLQMLAYSKTTEATLVEQVATKCAAWSEALQSVVRISADFRAFFERPWFTRTWILQEVLLSKDLVIQAGRSSLPFRDLRMLILLDPTLSSDLPKNMSTQDPLLRIPSLGLPKLLKIVAAQRDSTSYMSFWDSSAAVASFSLQSTRYLKYWQLFDVLYDTQELQCQDPRDKLFALLSLFGDRVPERLKPDYNRSGKAIYMDITYFLIQQEITRALSAAVGVRIPPTLPSWTIDWWQPPAREFLLSTSSIFISWHAGFATGRRQVVSSFCHSGILTLRGKRLQRITSVMDPVFPGIWIKSRVIGQDKTEVILENEETALVPYTAKINDIIVIFLGFEVPFVLRRSPTQSCGWLLVGECFFASVMDGEAVQDVDWDTISSKNPVAPLEDFDLY